MKEKKRISPLDMFLGGVLILIGLRMTFSCLVMMVVGSQLDIVSLISSPLMCFSGYQILTGKVKKKGKKKAAPEPKQAQPVRSFSFRGDHHEHIVPAGLSTERQLEQLDTLMGAGLYTKTQYLEAKAKILNA